MKVLFFVVLLSISSTAFITIYSNARFNPIDIHFILANLSLIESLEICICQCFMNSMCITGFYSGYTQYCTLYFSQLYEGHLQVMSINTNSSVFSFKNMTITASSVFNKINETVYGIWNTTVGGDSSVSLPGYSMGNYWPQQPPDAVLDDNVNSSYTSYGSCGYYISNISCGVNTGFYVTFEHGPFLLCAFRIRSGNCHSSRDPMTITLEGSNSDVAFLTLGSSWKLIYNGSTGLEIDPGRGMFGQTQIVTNSRWYSSYRLLVNTKRNNDTSVQYGEVQFLTY